jgi:hypothetical protein
MTVREGSVSRRVIAGHRGWIRLDVKAVWICGRFATVTYRLTHQARALGADPHIGVGPLRYSARPSGCAGAAAADPCQRRRPASSPICATRANFRA